MVAPDHDDPARDVVEQRVQHAGLGRWQRGRRHAGRPGRTEIAAARLGHVARPRLAVGAGTNT